MRRPTHPRGLTLIELVVAMGVAALVIAGVVGAGIAQQRAYHGTRRMREAQSSARSALLFVEEKLRLAGFGMDPALAFDFSVYAPAAAVCPAEASPCARDATDANDELVFYARNPKYWVPNNLTGSPVGHAWKIVSVASNSVKIQARPGDAFHVGQVLVAVCPGGRYYAYMTVGAKAATSTAKELTVTLADADVTNPFRRQDLAAGTASDPPTYLDATASGYPTTTVPSACFGAGEARLFQIDRYRFHVRPVELGTGPGGKKRYDPYLVLDTGVDLNDDGAIDDRDEQVIAEGVEIMQVAYTMASPTLPSATIGTASGKVIKLAAGLPGSTTTANEITTTPARATLPLTFAGAPLLTQADNPYAATSWYSYALFPPLPPSSPRLTDHQANIRSVRIGLVVRSPTPDLGAPTDVLLDSSFRLFNLSKVPTWISENAFPSAQDGYERVQVEASVLVPNMISRGMTFF
jgi:type IV pilus assembly protein PilW